MKYKCLDKLYTDSLCNIFINAISEKKVYNVFLGEQEEYRLINKDSFFTTITDMHILLEYVIYPLATNSRIDLKKIIYDVLDEAILNYEQLLPLYQIISFFYEQDLILEEFKNLPIIFSIEKYKKDIIRKVQLKKTELENYRKLGFETQINTMYEMIIGMINNSKSFK